VRNVRYVATVGRLKDPPTYSLRRAQVLLAGGDDFPCARKRKDVGVEVPFRFQTGQQAGAVRRFALRCLGADRGRIGPRSQVPALCDVVLPVTLHPNHPDVRSEHLLTGQIQVADV